MGLGFVPLGLSFPKCEYCPRPSSVYSSKFRIFCIETISTMLGNSSNPELLGFWQQITRSGIHDKNGKSLYLLGLLSSLRGHCPLHTDGFLVLHTYEQPWGSFPLLWCIWNTLGVRVFRNILSLVACGWSLDLTCLYLVLMDIQWTLVLGCLGIRALAGIIIFGRVAGKSKLAGDQHLCFVCLWFSIRHTHLLKECNQLKKKVRMLLNENRKLLVEQADQEASFGEEKSSVMRPARTYIPSAKQQQVGWCVSEADFPHG